MNARVIARADGAVTAVLGAITILDARRVSRFAAGDGAVPDVRIVRALGARQLVQGLVLVARPDPLVVRGAVVVDVLHAGSMLPLAATRFRRAALISAATASATAVAAAVAVGQSRGQ